MVRTPRFVTPLGSASPGTVVVLPTTVAHQVLRVLRLRPGDRLDLLDGTGGSWHATLDVGTTPARATATLGTFVPVGASDLGRHVTLILGLLRADKFDWVVQKATELGVARIVPIVTARSVATSGRPDRWRRIAAEATEQSGRTVVPTIDDPTPFRSTLTAGSPETLRIACWEDESIVAFRDAITADGSHEPVAVWVGPEGGISMEEAGALRDSGATTATLGPRILRSETAAIVAVAQAVGTGWS
jgi:16S rRNA (uracil1498-N3)-methyltransferase